MIWNKSRRALAVLLAAMAALQGCTDKAATTPSAPAASASPQAFAPITIEHKLGTTVLKQRPQRVAVLDMNEVDFLDQLGVPVAGMVKDYVPHFLTRYKDDQGIRDLGAIVQPNLEHIHALQPDLILMTSIQANHYKELSQIAPTLHFDVDYQNSESKHIEVVKQHLLTLGRIFGKEDIASRKAAELDAKVADARKVTQERPEKALIVLHNNGAFSSFGVRSRYGFVFDALGVKPASSAIEAGLHGQPISSEFIQQANPDIIYVVDRTAVMEHRPVMTAEQMANPLLRQTNAWKNGRVVFVDADAWYITAASVTSLKRVIDDVLKGYQ
ncbi:MULTISPECIES: siderophore ABC transporter substrate-binding protein [unclassified Janthinobacterium]|uniref:siderophore ABC transporter substrate-binding protein n=1 Tax=unclassified Janthinobacterium TaxID=2610881 RepID=UPI000C16BE3D|nr:MULTISPECIES: siderophore ABC transporter substrate-binding protein [unclassified Janthinobacterium]MDN2678775.1 siderophore ABC transporter substrate-binding protein [Janthinobacterium sp. SUN033]MDO8074455.1 siderophore ABC transporter substrate-binding protein [Janthinobacterium sp. SUN176]MED5614320.1 siderophore ABC transporter substrate-binding protein [Janthinobacterium sp. P210005]PIF10254.1 iron complex transport system substrate-binding protein [Janthinobacterium sp. 13]